MRSDYISVLPLEEGIDWPRCFPFLCACGCVELNIAIERLRKGRGLDEAVCLASRDTQ